MTGAATREAAMHSYDVAIRESHVSVVFLVGARAYKLKKPVQFGFIDLSTREARERLCRREVELNRRLAPDVYLGVADVSGPDGAPYDHLVVMRRMPDARRLSTLVRADEVGDEDLQDLAHVIASFHARADRSPVIDDAARAGALRVRWETGFREIAPFAGPLLDPSTEAEIEHLARRYLDGRTALFDQRIALGKARDGHGDLLADDVFLLDDGPRVLDCLEFADELRYGDVLADVAFLAMDLERVGAPELADGFLARYRELAAETYPQTLADHYIAFRAHIRAKVACLRDAQGADGAAAEARRLLDIAVAHLRKGRVVLALVGGGPGTGKSTLAAAIAERLGWSVLRSDEVRKDLVGVSHAQPAPAAFGRGIYDDETTAATYRELLARAKVLLENGAPVVLDASWSDAGLRADAHALATATASDLVELRCDVALEVAVGRMTARSGSGDPSDATPEVARALADRAVPWPSATTIDTSGTPAEALTTALASIGVDRPGGDRPQRPGDPSDV